MYIKEIYRTLQKTPNGKSLRLNALPFLQAKQQNVNTPNRPHYGTAGKIPTGS